MPLVIPCPSCKAKLKAPETLVGKTVKCPNCQSPIAVRAPANTPAPPAKAAAAPAKKPAPQNDFDFNDDPDDRPSKKGGAVKKGRDDDYDDDRPAKKGGAARRDDYDDEDDRPSKKGGAIKKGRDDYADDLPRKGKGRDDDYDDEDDVRPSKKGKKGKGVGPSGPTTEEERSNAFMIYIAALVGQFIGIGPFGGIIWWVIKRGESRFVDHHGKEFMNLMITNFLIIMLCVALIVIGIAVGASTESGLFVAIFAGLGGFIMVAWGLTSFVLMIIAMFKAKGGEWYRYPMIWHLLKV